MTFSICVRERYTDDDGDDQIRFGVAVTTRLPGVGTLCPFASSDGAVATQSLVNVELGRKGIEYLGDGLAVDDALEALLNADEGSAQRQLHGVDAVELALGATLVGVEQGLQGVVDRQAVAEVLDPLPPQLDVDERLGRHRPVRRGERTQRADARQPGRHRHAEPDLVVAVIVGVPLADADAERHTGGAGASRKRLRAGADGSGSKTGRGVRARAFARRTRRPPPSISRSVDKTDRRTVGEPGGLGEGDGAGQSVTSVNGRHTYP